MRGRLAPRPKSTFFRGSYGFRAGVLAILTMRASDRNPLSQPSRRPRLTSGAALEGWRHRDDRAQRPRTGAPPYSAASARFFNGRPSCSHTSTSAAASASINASVWNGDGVMRSRSVPFGTVG